MSVGRQSDCQLTGSQINEMIFYTRPLSNQFDSSLQPVFIEVPPVGRKKKAITFKTVNKNSREELRRIIISSRPRISHGNPFSFNKKCLQLSPHD